MSDDSVHRREGEISLMSRMSPFDSLLLNVHALMDIGDTTMELATLEPKLRECIDEYLVMREGARRWAEELTIQIEASQYAYTAKQQTLSHQLRHEDVFLYPVRYGMKAGVRIPTAYEIALTEHGPTVFRIRHTSLGWVHNVGTNPEEIALYPQVHYYAEHAAIDAGLKELHQIAIPG